MPKYLVQIKYDFGTSFPQIAIDQVEAADEDEATNYAHGNISITAELIKPT